MALDQKEKYRSGRCWNKTYRVRLGREVMTDVYIGQRADNSSATADLAIVPDGAQAARSHRADAIVEVQIVQARLLVCYTLCDTAGPF